MSINQDPTQPKVTEDADDVGGHARHWALPDSAAGDHTETGPQRRAEDDVEGHIKRHDVDGEHDVEGHIKRHD